ncbi:MAG: hypothetical protein ACFB9M_20720 [Myxococcota bacterium]
MAEVGLVLAALLLGLMLGSVVSRRRPAPDLRSLDEAVQRDRHDWNNHVMTLLLNTSSLRLRLASLVSSDTHRSLGPLVDDIEANSRILMRREERLDKLLALRVDKLDCDPSCRSCREVDDRAADLVANLAVNAKEAAARAGRGQVVARCNHTELTITNPRPDRSDLHAKAREHFGLRQVTRHAHALDWEVSTGPVDDPDGPLWRAMVHMEPSSTALEPQTASRTTADA